jgi:hypothetical protein
VNPLRWAWAWLRFLGREKPPWYYGEDQIALSENLEYDEEAGEIRPKP